MRIQWSSEAARNMLEELRRVEQGARECEHQAARARLALADANRDGENRALNEAQKRFEYCAHRLRRLADAIEEFQTALMKADAEFEDAEASVGNLADNMEQPEHAPVGREERRAHFFQWEPAAFEVMPRTLPSTAPMPEWIVRAANGADVLLF